MRIVHVIDSLDPAVGGPRAVVFSLAGAEAMLGHDVRIVGYHAEAAVANDLASRNAVHGMDRVRLVPMLHRRPKHRKMDQRDLSTLRAALTTADIIHLHGVWDPILLEAGYIAADARIPYILAPHGMLDHWAMAEKPLKKSIALLLGRRSLIRCAAAIHALSEHERECISRGAFHTNIAVIPNGVTLQDIDPIPASGAFRAAHPALGNDPFVLLLARLHGVKGLDILADAFATLRAKHPTLRLVIAGPDEGAGKAFQAQAQRLGVADRVHLVGPVYGRAKFEAYADAACFCLPSKHEAFSMSIAEALACRTPLVITQECNLPAVAEANAGQVVKRNPQAVAAGIDHVLTNPQLAADAANRGRALIESRFTWPTIARQACTLYDTALSGDSLNTAANIAIITNVETPYRVALHRRIVNEIPELRLNTLYTHGLADQPWTTPLAQDINPVVFGTNDGVDASAGPASVLRDFRKAGRIMEWIIQNRVQAVFLSGYNDVGRFRLFRWCHSNGIPVFLVADSNIYGDRASGIRRFVKGAVVRQVVRWSNAILPFGSAGARYFFRYGADTNKVISCPYEPDYKLIESLPQSFIDEAAAKFSLDPNRKRLVYCGRMQQVKRPDMAILGFIRVADKLPDWDLVLIGDGTLMPKCKALVPDHLKHRVKFVGFVGDQRVLTAIYKQSDILVIPSDADAWGLVVNEAAQAGMAIIASDVVGAAPELVRDGLNGGTFRRGDPDDLARVILDVARPEALPAMKAASIKVIADWRKRGDPIIGFRLALSRVGVLRPGNAHAFRPATASA